MKCLKLEYADAFLLGPGAHVPLEPRWSLMRTWNMLYTVGGNRVVIPNPGNWPISCDYKWPVLPLVEHRGGYFTATAKYYLEIGWPVFDGTGRCIRDLGGPMPRTGHRVFWVDRNRAWLVMDVIKRPKPDIMKYIPVVTGVDRAQESYTVAITKDLHLEVAQLLFGKACPKCGSKELKPRWGDGNGPTCGYLGLCRWVKEPLCFNHIHVTCQVCHYEWLEEPLDAAETA